MPVQQRVNRQLPAAYHGDFASANPRVSLIGGYSVWKAGANGVKVGSFVWADDARGVLNNSGTGNTSYTVATAVIVAAGTGYAVGDTLNAPGVNATVSTIGANGAVTAINIVATPAQTTDVAGTGIATTTNGAGSGATLTTTTTASATYTKPDGFVHRQGLSIIQTIPQSVSMVVPAGTAVTAFEKTEAWYELPAGVTALRKARVFCDPTTGEMVAAGTAGAVDTGFVFATGGVPTGLVKISAWLEPAA